MSLILVADSHIEPGGIQERTFFKMLTQLGKSAHDVVFLGDIFGLWIALPGYEGKTQQAFLQWCRRQKASRTIGFVEGNHEFFVSARHADSFSWSTSNTYWREDDGLLFVHGDQINHSDKRYLLFRRITKNAVTRTLLRYLPGGPHICNRLRQMLRHTNQQYRQGLPEKEIRYFAAQHYGDAVKAVFAGHFHTSGKYVHPSSGTLYLLPAWLDSGQVTLVDNSNENLLVQSAHWDALPN